MSTTPTPSGPGALAPASVSPAPSPAFLRDLQSRLEQPIAQIERILGPNYRLALVAKALPAAGDAHILLTLITREEIVAVLDRHLPAKAMPDSDWQPIDTAPRDGSRFLVYEDFEPTMEAAWIDADGDLWRCTGGSPFWRRPTHWRPWSPPPPFDTPAPLPPAP